MTAEQLEELLRRSIFSEDDSRQLSSMAPSLARRVLAAEKLVEAIEWIAEAEGWQGDKAHAAITAYRKARGL